MKSLFFILSFLALSLTNAQDLKGLWIDVMQESGEYSEINLISFDGELYEGKTHDYDPGGGFCKFKHRAKYDPVANIYLGKDYELIDKTSNHQATVVRLQYIKDGEDEYLIGTERISQNGVLSVAQMVKYKKQKPEITEEEITEEEINLVKSYIKTRKNPKKASINIFTEKFTLKVKDYGQEDNDSISIFLNEKIIAYKIPINSVEKEFEIEIDLSKKNNQLYFIANNEGEVPPNTTNVVLEIEGKKFEYTLFTDLKKNVLIDLISMQKKE